MPLALCCAAVSPLLLAQDPEASLSKTRWTGELGIGAEYDTNVSVDEVDLSSGQSDYAGIIDFKLALKHVFSESTEASLNYDISQSSYSEFSEVDRLTQIIGGDINTDLSLGNAGISAYYIDSQLDGEAFLQYVRVSPYVSGFLARRWFARSAYVYSEREIDDRPERDAQTQSGEIDIYFFKRGLRSYFNLGYRYRDEDAIADELDFAAHSLKFRYIRRFDFWQRQAKAEFAVRYELRDYISNEPTIDEPRKDDRLRWKFDLDLPLNNRFTWQWYYSYGDYVSNLPRADFTQTIIGTRLEFTW
jgi:hypothetical protein